MLPQCETDFDAVAMIRSEMWVFKGNYFWRIDRSDTGAGAREDPIELSAFWEAIQLDKKSHKSFIVARLSL